MKLSENKGKHTLGVAGFMYDHAKVLGLNPEEMYTLGLLHDVGYIYDAEGHAKNGGKLLKSQGYKFADCVYWHGSTPKTYMQENNVNSIPNELILLWMADLSIDSKGVYVGYGRRLNEICSRYGSDSVKYICAKDTIEYLIIWEFRNQDLYIGLSSIPKYGIEYTY